MSKYYVTTSIPYINGEPHLGHAMEFVIADVLARHARQQGNDVIFSTGTDEHGGKIAEKAKSLGLTPKALADQMSKKFEDLCKLLNISNDRFIRTTDPAHERSAGEIWQKLAGDIYKAKYIGWYCTGDEAFFSEAEVKANKGICPNHNRPYEKLEEDNYFFSLSKYSSKIAEAIKSNQFKILPETRRNEILSLIDSGLEDISISRPKDKLAWGIPVPGDTTQVMYVWFEALMNYITVLGYPDHADFKDYWPADVQVIGKDIIRFHAAIWPAMLLGLGLPLPKVLYVHGFINIEGRKMSKSLGNSVAPEDIIANYGADPLRYYLLRHIPSYSDGDFSLATFEAAYNNELANELGNGLSRTLAMVERYLDGDIGEIPPPEHDIAGYDLAIDECRLDRALEVVFERVKGLNQYIEEAKPWELAKGEDKEHLKEVLVYQVSSLLQIAGLLEPFLPSTAAKIQAAFSGGKAHKMSETLFPRKDND
ncbi:MAG TPA: methionine--tRNA ligase [Candidatus Saccharimonadales bacterium]|jgi:methionyl-tRNA synthetase